MKIRCGKYLLESDRPLVMGIVNLTLDSFSGDGMAENPEAAVGHARRLIDEGADILDIGAESSRPGARPISVHEEVARLMPVMNALQNCGVPISVDTCKPRVMAYALAAGADMINDITGFRDPDAIRVVASSQCGLCIMHMKGEPRTMQNDPQYDDVASEVRSFLAERVDACRAAGIAGERLVLDPGFGFGKTLDHNLALFRQLHALKVDNLPLLVGLSRKSMLGAITGKPVEDRLAASLTAATLAVQRGASIVRVHDVAATRDALAVMVADTVVPPREDA